MKPCRECPFLKREIAIESDLGGSSVEVYLGQILHSFWLPCHMDVNYANKESDPSKVAQCRGAALLRGQFPNRDAYANINLLVGDSTESSSFKSIYEFYAHYKETSLERAHEILTPQYLLGLIQDELHKLTMKNIINTKDVKDVKL